MTKNVNVKQITLPVNGKVMTFSEEELISILEKYFNSTNESGQEAIELVKTPTEGKFFKVDPTVIDETLFKEKRKDSRQEITRQIIWDAIINMKMRPKKYAKPFKTMIPVKTWTETKKAEEFKEIASNLGDHMADWVEQALEWAQRITNGESWEEICNNPDTANWHRIILWKDYVRLVGGSCNKNDNVPASTVHDDQYFYGSGVGFDTAVPLVVGYK